MKNHLKTHLQEEKQQDCLSLAFFFLFIRISHSKHIIIRLACDWAYIILINSFIMITSNVESMLSATDVESMFSNVTPDNCINMAQDG